MVHFGGIALALFLDLLLLTKRNKSRADWILASWLLVIALHLLMFTFLKLKWYPELWGIDLPLPLLHGPLLYLYTRALTGKSIGVKDLAIHFALPGAFYIYLIRFISLPASQKLFVYEHEGVGYEAFLMVSSLCIPLSGIVYIGLSLLLLRSHRKKIVEQFSSVDKVNLAWLQYLIVWLAVIWALVIFGNDDLIFGAVVVFIVFMGFFGIRQGVIFEAAVTVTNPAIERETITLPETIAQPDPKVKYQKSGLSVEASGELHRKLVSVMRTEHLYRNCDLTLVVLATYLNCAPNHLSQVINEREDKNFYDYINSLRIEEFMARATLPESRKLTLFAIAQECGFNSKSSFNRYFKKITGRSPSEYMDQPVASDK